MPNYLDIMEVKKTLRRFWDLDDIIEIINKSFDHGINLNMYHTYDNELLYITANYGGYPYIRIYGENRNPYYREQNGAQTPIIWMYEFNKKICDTDLIDIKGSNINKLIDAVNNKYFIYINKRQ